MPRPERTLHTLRERFGALRISDAGRPTDAMRSRKKGFRRERRAAQRAVAKAQRGLEQQLHRVKAMTADLKSARKAQVRAERALEKKSAALESLKRELALTHRYAYESSTPGIPGWEERWRERPGRRVLQVGSVDTAGSMIEWARAVNLHTEYAVRLAMTREHPYHYDADLIVSPPPNGTRDLRPRQARGLAALVAEADVIHVKDEAIWTASSPLQPSWFLSTGKPVIFTCSGSYTRQWLADPELLEQLVAHTGDYAACIALTPDLLHPALDATFIPHAMDCSRFEFTWTDRRAIAHSPSAMGRKATALLAAALADVRRDHDVELDVIRDVSNAECLARKQRAGLFFDQAGSSLCQVVGWYGKAALEAAVAGVPTVAHLVQPALAHLRRIGDPLAGDLEIVNVYRTANDLRDTIVQFFDASPEERLSKAIATRAWVERHHDYPMVASRLASLYNVLT